MKRIISITLTIVMVMATMCVPAMATETTGSKVFSLDFSDYATGGSIKNGVTNSATGITPLVYTANTSATGPATGKEYTVNGNVIEYIQFADDAVYETYGDRTAFRNSHNYGAVRLSPELMQTLLNGSDAMTIEFWMQPYANYKQDANKKYYATASSNLYTYGVGTDAASSASQFEVYDANNCDGFNNTYNIYPMGKMALKNSEGNTVKVVDSKYSASSRYLTHTNKPWVHYVITREWKYDDGSNTTGDYYWSVYENGTSRTSSVSNTTTFGENIVKNDESALPFVIGGSDNGADGNAAANAFDGAIAEFNIYNYAMNSTQAAVLYADVNYAKYKAERLAESISLTAPTAGTELALAAGEIELTFDNFVDQASLSKIKMVDTNNNEIKGGILVSTPEAFSKTVTVKYGTPTAGATYKLVIPADFKSVNGYTIGADKELTYTAKADRIIVDHDFSALPEKAESGSSGFKYTNGTVGTDYVATTYNGVEALKINDTTVATKYFGYVLPVSDKRDMKFTISVAIDGANAANQRNIRLGHDYSLMNIAATTSLDNYKDANGFATFTAELSYDGTDTNYSAYLFDSTGTQKGKSTGKSLNSGTKGIYVQHHHNPAGSGDSTYISQYKVEVMNRPEVFYHNADGIEASANAIELVLSDDITGTGVTATLTDTTDSSTVTLGNITYTDNARKLTIALPDGLTEGHNYSLTLNGVVSTSGDAMDSANALTFTATAADVPAELVSTVITFTDEKDAVIEGLDNQTEINAAFTLTNNKTSEVTPYIFLVLYDENNRMVAKTLVNTYTIAANGGTQDYTVILAIPENTDLSGCTVKCIGLESISTCAPIFADEHGYCL